MRLEDTKGLSVQVLRRHNIKMPSTKMQLCADGKMNWELPKQNYGSRSERHRLRRFLRDRVARIPLTVRVAMVDRPRSFAFAPAYVNGQYKFVSFRYRRYVILMKYNDVAPWIRVFIHSNRLFENPRFHHAIDDMIENPL